jgi:hypothetical protein
MTQVTLTKRQYLTIKACLPTGDGIPVDMFMAMEAVASTAIEHPEWDMDEQKTWREWEIRPKD